MLKYALMMINCIMLGYTAIVKNITITNENSMPQTLPEKGRPSNLMLKIISGLSMSWSLASLIAQTRAGANPTEYLVMPTSGSRALILTNDWQVENTIDLQALIIFFVRRHWRSVSFWHQNKQENHYNILKHVRMWTRNSHQHEFCFPMKS